MCSWMFNGGMGFSMMLFGGIMMLLSGVLLFGRSSTLFVNLRREEYSLRTVTH
jgi:hypothetical protein